MSASSNKRARRNVLVVPCHDRGPDLVIDENDYLVVKEIIRYGDGGIPDDSFDSLVNWPSCIRDITRIHERDEERRVCQLFITNFVEDMLSDVIAQLSSLETLVLHRSQLESFPSSVGRLQNLRVIDLYRTELLTELPEEIWDLPHLDSLCLEGSSDFESLPSSIGRLQSLEALNLSGTGISSLPDEIGNLTSLKLLDVSDTCVESLPGSIGDLTSLQVLSLSSTCITSLPDSFGRLTGLLYLWLPGTKENEEADFLCRLAKSHPLLNMLRAESAELPSVSHALARNRAKTRMGRVGEQHLRALVPRLLELSRSSFQKFPYAGFRLPLSTDTYNEFYGEKRGFKNQYCPDDGDFEIGEFDAVYLLLRFSLVEVLVGHDQV